MAQTIEGFVGNALDNAKITPLHVKVIALIAAGYFFDVIDVIVLGSLIPDMLASKFATGPEAGLVGAATVFGMFIGTAGQGEFSDRWGRKTIYQFNLLLFGTFTILGAFAPTVTWLIVARFIAGIGIGAEQPLAFSYAGEYSPKAIRGHPPFPPPWPPCYALPIGVLLAPRAWFSPKAIRGHPPFPPPWPP